MWKMQPMNSSVTNLHEYVQELDDVNLTNE